MVRAVTLILRPLDLRAPGISDHELVRIFLGSVATGEEDEQQYVPWFHGTY
jgi:hypothetical protein